MDGLGFVDYEFLPTINNENKQVEVDLLESNLKIVISKAIHDSMEHQYVAAVTSALYLNSTLIEYTAYQHVMREQLK